MAERAGLHKGISPHDFRRTGVTTIAKVNGPLEAQAWAGHDKLSSTDRYIRDDKSAARREGFEGDSRAVSATP